MINKLVAPLLSLGLSWSLLAQADPDHPPGSQQAPQASERSVSWREMIPNVASDQNQIWVFPARLTHNHYWIPGLAVAAVTAGLVAADSWTGNYLATTNAFHGFNSALSSTNTSAGIIAAPVMLYAVGLLTKNSRAAHTALLAGEAVVNSEIVATLLKTATRRERPKYFSSPANLADSWWEGPSGFGLGHGAFPSGHTIAAFSVATVISRRYGKAHRWVPFVAYGLAANVGFSRMTTLSHFPSDVFLGGALGYSVSRFAVLR